MIITEQAATVLQEIDAALALADKATVGPWETTDIDCVERPKKKGFNVGNFPDADFIAAARTVCPTALRCLKTAIEGLLRVYDNSGSEDDQIAIQTLTTLITQWNSK